MAKPTVDQFPGFTRLTAPAPHRIIASSFGEVGTLKTSFWLGAPGPIAIFSFDRGLEGVVESYQQQKDIYAKEYDWDASPGATVDQSEAIAIRDQFTIDFEQAIQHARTVIIDKETDMWSIFKYAEFGAPEKGRPDDWDKLKGRVRRIMNMPKSLSCNFGVIQGMKNEWIPQTNNKTGTKGITQSGKRIRAGSDDIEAIMHINIEHVREDGEFKMKVGKARGPGGREIQYQTLPAMTFADFGGLVFPDSTEDSWV
jgi:hypothetical protein